MPVNKALGVYKVDGATIKKGLFMRFTALIFFCAFSFIANAQDKSIEHLDSLATIYSACDVCASTYKNLGYTQKANYFAGFYVELFKGVSKLPDYEQKYFFSASETEIEQLKALTLPAISEKCEDLYKSLIQVQSSGK